MTDQCPRVERRFRWMRFWWCRAGTGIDIDPSCDVYGLKVGTRFVGVIHRARDNPRSAPGATITVTSEAGLPEIRRTIERAKGNG